VNSDLAIAIEIQAVGFLVLLYRESLRLEGSSGGHQACWKGRRGTGGWQSGHEPAMCSHSPESHPYFGLRKQNSGQKGKGGDPAPLLCSGETSPGVLHSDVESSVQERCRPVGVHPEGSHKNDAQHGTSRMRTGWDSWGCSAARRLQGDLIRAFQYLKGSYRKEGDRFFSRIWQASCSTSPELSCRHTADVGGKP